MRDITRHVPKRLLRPEIRRRALRAATAVAVGAVAGCGSIDDAVVGAAYVDATAGADGQVGMGRAQDAATGHTVDGGRSPLDGGAAMADAGVSGADSTASDAGSVTPLDAIVGGTSDASTGVVCKSTDDWKDFQRCCDENGWDWNKGCMAWGPPAPPALDDAVLAALIAGLYGAEVAA